MIEALDHATIGPAIEKLYPSLLELTNIRRDTSQLAHLFFVSNNRRAYSRESRWLCDFL